MNATKKHVPGKRLRTWHRKHTTSTISLRGFVRYLAANGTDDQKQTANQWIAGKGRRS